MPQGFGKKGTPAPNHPCSKGPSKFAGMDFDPTTMRIILSTSPYQETPCTDDGHSYAELMQGTE